MRLCCCPAELHSHQTRRWPFLRGHMHQEMLKYSLSTSMVQAKGLQNLRVPCLQVPCFAPKIRALPRNSVLRLTCSLPTPLLLHGSAQRLNACSLQIQQA